MRPFQAVLAGLALISCGDGGTLYVPRPDPGAGVLLAVERGVTLGLYALEGADPLSVELDSDVEGSVLTVLGYRHSLAELQIPAGPVERANAEQDRPLPTPDVAASGIYSMGTLSLSPVQSLSAGLLAFRLPALDRVQCAANGGCMDSQGAPDRCLLPCPEPSPIAPPAEPDPPTPPEPPRFLPCPPGWVQAQSDPRYTLAHCEPAPAPEAVSCADTFSVQRYGAAACEAIGRPCPQSGDFADELPPGPLRFVLLGASGGDGTRALPFGSIGAALAGAVPGTTVVIGTGSYSEAFALPDGVSLLGACPARTFLTSSVPLNDATVVVVGSGAIRNLRLSGLDRGVDLGGGPSAVTIEDVLIEDTGGPGVSVRSLGAATLNRVVVRRSSQYGAVALREGTLVADDLVIEGSGDSGVHCDLSSAQIQRLVVRDTNPSPINGIERGVSMAGCGLVLQNALIEDSAQIGLELQTSSATISDLVVRRIAAPGGSGRGINVQGGSAVLARVLVQATSECGLAFHTGARVRSTDLIVREHGRAPGDVGFALCLEQSNVDLLRTWLDQVGNNGLSARFLAAAAGEGLRSQDLWLRDVRGTALVPVSSAIGPLERVLIEGSTHGMVADTASATISDLRMNIASPSGLEPLSDHHVAMQFEPAAHLTLRRAAFGPNFDFVLAARSQSSFTLSDVQVASSTSALDANESVIWAERMELLDPVVGVGLDNCRAQLSSLRVSGSSNRPRNVWGINSVASELMLSRARIDGFTNGINLAGPAQLTDVLVSGTFDAIAFGKPLRDPLGPGQQRVDLTRVQLEGTERLSLLNRGGAALTAVDVSTSGGESGLRATTGFPRDTKTELLLERFHITGALMGVDLAQDRDAPALASTLRDGTITGCGTGVQTLGEVDRRGLFERVIYTDNETVIR